MSSTWADTISWRRQKVLLKNAYLLPLSLVQCADGSKQIAQPSVFQL